jgi:hypothetical protein
VGKRVSADEYFDLSKNPLHSAVGEAIEAYTQVEAALARLLQSILKIDVVKAQQLMSSGGSKPAVISALALGLVYPSHRTVRVGTSRSCHGSG